jgi:hypothetical protein
MLKEMITATIVAVLSIIGMSYCHEWTHHEIYHQYGCDSTISLITWGAQTVPEEGCYISPNGILANCIVDIVGYLFIFPLSIIIWILYYMSFVMTDKR